jgi:type VI secretion system protein ImpH
VSPEPTVEQRLFKEGYAFDFFQAVRLLEKLAPQARPVGRPGPPGQEVVHFRAHLALEFPASAIYEIERQPAGRPQRMTVTFMGLTGFGGVLPTHYTQLLMQLERYGRRTQRTALRDWLDLFNHRLISLFYRAWEKYRFWRAFERGDHAGPEPDPFTRCLFSFVGLGLPALRNRLGVSLRVQEAGVPAERPLARVDDLVLLHYSGFLAHRPRCSVSLEALLADYFALPVKVEQFRGQWLRLDRASQSRMGAAAGANNRLGVNVVAGERVWDVQNKVRIRLGPLGYGRFTEFLPDRSPVALRKAFFLLSHLVRLYVGPELDFDVQLVLRAPEVPACQLNGPADGLGPRLGWNTWLCSRPPARDAGDAFFQGEELRWLEGPPGAPAAATRLPAVHPLPRQHKETIRG